MIVKIKNKNAAIELSIGTVVVIVLAMSMLVLGIVLIRNIFAGATISVDILNDRVIGEITSLFADEGSYVVVKLGADQTAKIKQGSGPFRIAIGATKTDSSQITSRDAVQYKLTLDTSPGNCASSSSYTEASTKKIFKTTFDNWNSFDKFQGSQTFALVELNIPDGMPLCTQKVNLDVKERASTNSYAGNFFIIEVQKKGFLG